ncbi:MAG: hypothetical protein Q9221_007869 [Calogaya cf. arnoldii]
MPSTTEEPEFTAQILSKDDYSKQSIVTLTSSSDLEDPLPPSAVRVQTTLIALTANNLGYAALGTQLHWWDTFPVPTSAPPPFNDSSAYGLVPAWGYATVLSSTIPSIPSGSLLWGCYPPSTHPITLRLQPTQPQTHWLETSPHRKNLMPLYQRYVLASKPPSHFNKNPASATRDKFAKTALLKPLWEAAYLLNRFVFAPHQPTQQLTPIHPFGDGTWTAKDSDLKSAIIVIVAASSKTGTAFVSELRFSREPGTGPLAILTIASKIPDNAPPYTIAESSPPLRNVTYNSMTASSTLDWLKSFSTGGAGASRIKIIDFGGRDGAADRLVEAVKGHAPLAGLDVQVVGVGGVLKPGGSDQWKEGRVASNASSARDKAVERIGAEGYFDGLERAFEEVMERGGLGLEVEVGRGVEGEGGVEGGWKRLCEGRVDGRMGLAFWV